MPTITNPETPLEERGKLRCLLREVLHFIRAYRLRRRLQRKWNRMSPHEQLAFWMSVLASDPQLRDAFRRAIRVRGIPESQQDSRRVISAEEFMRAAQDTARKAGVMLT